MFEIEAILDGEINVAVVEALLVDDVMKIINK